MIKNYIKTGLFMALMAVMPMSFTSCSSDDDNTTRTEADVKNTALQNIVNNYVNNVVYPTYTNLANETWNLYDGLVSLQTKLTAGTLTDSDIDAVCETFLKARAYWEESEAWLYGPADVLGIDPHIDTWPLDRSELATLLSGENYSKLEGEAGIEYVSSQNQGASQLGFHGVEFVLFRNGENRSAADLTGYETDDAFTANTVTGAQELVYAIAVAGDLRDWCSRLEYAWLGDAAATNHIARCTTRGFQIKLDGLTNYYGAELLAANTSELFKTWRLAMSYILVDGCSNICAEVADQKMGQPYRAATGTATSDEQKDEEYVGREYIESPYSHKSFVDFRDNIESIKNALYGNIDGTTYEANSIMAYLTTYNPSLATTLQTNLTAATASLDACINNGTAFVTIINNNNTAGLALVSAAMSAISTLDETINEANTWIAAN